MRSAGRSVLSLLGLLAAMVSSAGMPVRAEPAEREIWLYSIHTRETLRIVYKRAGRYIPAALEKINWQLRDWRRNEPTRMDPKLIDLVADIHAELGSRKPVYVISGYRSLATNNMLRRSRGGQARRSQHLLGRAMDVHFPDVPVRRLRYSALVREQGGVGYYPTSATPFVHVDTGRVRHWPRMDRMELALLFPNGQTRHRPRTGGPIQLADVRRARLAKPRFAQRIAAFHGARREALVALRRGRGPEEPRIALLERPRPAPRPRDRAAKSPSVKSPSAKSPSQARAPSRLSAWGYTLSPAPKVAKSPPPSLTERPRLAARTVTAPPAATAKPESSAPGTSNTPGYDREQLARLALANLLDARTPSAPTAWVPSPAYDDEHPDELSYRPFPILPYITATASPDDPALTQLTHPDVERTLDALEDSLAVGPPLQFRPGIRVANLLWAQTFSGNAVDLKTMAPRRAPQLDQRRVATAGQ